MSTSEIDEFVEAFLDRVTAGGDVKKASAAIQLFLDDVKGMKKEALSSPSLFGPQTSPKPGTGFSPSPLPTPPTQPATTGLQPIQQLAPSNLYSGTEMDIPTAADAQNKLRGFTPPPPMPSALPPLGAPLPSLLPKPVEPAEEPNWRAFYGKPDSATRPIDEAWSTGNRAAVVRRAVQDRMARTGETMPVAFQSAFGMPYDPSLLSRVQEPDLLAAPEGEKPYAPSAMKKQVLLGAKQQADSARYSDASAAARAERQLVEQGKERFAKHDAELAASRAAEAGKARGRMQDTVNRYTGGIRAQVQQQNAAKDALGKVTEFARGLPAAASRGLAEAGRPDRQRYEAAQAAGAAQLKSMGEEGAKLQRVRDLIGERDARMFDTKRQVIRDYDKGLDTDIADLRGQIAGHDTLPRGGQMQERNGRPFMPTPSGGSFNKLLARDKAEAAIANLENQRIVKRAPAATDIAGKQQERAQLGAWLKKTSGVGSAIGEAGTKAYDWTAGKVNQGLDWTSNLAKDSPAYYGAGLGALVGGASTVLSSRRKDGSKPWLRNMLLGGLAGGALMGGLNRLSKWAPQPAAPLSTAPKGP